MYPSVRPSILYLLQVLLKVSSGTFIYYNSKVCSKIDLLAKTGNANFWQKNNIRGSLNQFLVHNVKAIGFFLRYLDRFFYDTRGFPLFLRYRFFTILSEAQVFYDTFLYFWGPFEISLYNIFTTQFFFDFFTIPVFLRYIFLPIPVFTGIVKHRKKKCGYRKKNHCLKLYFGPKLAGRKARFKKSLLGQKWQSKLSTWYDQNLF